MTDTASPPGSRRWLMLPVVLLAMFMAGFDIWVVNVAAPSLQRDLHVSDAALQLIVGGYAFMYASGMVTGGRLGDLVGYRRMFMIGVASFAVASLLCGLAQSPAELVGARLLQGLTGAAMVPQVLALITATFPAPERSRALAWFGVTMGLAFVSGQILGGLLLQANVLGLGWRAIFLVNVPVGAATLIAAAIVVPHARGHRRPRLDPLGAAGVSASVALALVPLTLGHDEGWPAWTWICLAACLPVLALTLAWERRLTRRGGEPLLDLPLFRDRAFSAGAALNFALLFFFGSFMFVLTLLLQAGLGQSPLRAGPAGRAAGPDLHHDVDPRAADGGPARAVVDHHRGGSRRARHDRPGPHRPPLRKPPNGLGSRPGDGADRPGPGHGAAVADRDGAGRTCRPGGPARRPGSSRPRSSSAWPAGSRSSGRCSTPGSGPGRASSVAAMELAMTIDAVVVLAAAALTLLLPRRAAARRPAVTEEPTAELSAGAVGARTRAPAAGAGPGRRTAGTRPGSGIRTGRRPPASRGRSRCARSAP